MTTEDLPAREARALGLRLGRREKNPRFWAWMKCYGDGRWDGGGGGAGRMVANWLPDQGTLQIFDRTGGYTTHEDVTTYDAAFAIVRRAEE